MVYPKTFAPGDGPAEIVALVKRLVPMLIAGDHPALVALREQWMRAQIGTIELTGVGFFAALSVPSDSRRADPANMTGGSATIEVAGMEHGAGCVLFVRNGHLDTLEGYTHDGEWPPDARILHVSKVTPIDARTT